MQNRPLHIQIEQSEEESTSQSSYSKLQVNLPKNLRLGLQHFFKQHPSATLHLNARLSPGLSEKTYLYIDSLVEESTETINTNQLAQPTFHGLFLSGTAMLLTNLDPAFALALGTVISVATYATSRKTSIDTLSNITFNVKTTAEQDRIVFNNIQSHNMINTHPNEIGDTSWYCCGFTTKTAFADWTKKSPLTHSSLTFIPVTDMDEMKKMSPTKRKQHAAKERVFLVIGRQSVAFRKEQVKVNDVTPTENKETQIELTTHQMTENRSLLSSLYQSLPQFSLIANAKSGIQVRLNNASQAAKTEIDNENMYSLFPDVPFVAQMTTAEFSGTEIKYIVDSTNKNVCDVQVCDFVRSNCYSASIYMMATAIEVLDKRALSNLLTDKQKGIIDKQMVDLASLLFKVVSNNLAQGILNNHVIVGKLNEALNRLAARGLIVETVEKVEEKATLRHRQ